MAKRGRCSAELENFEAARPGNKCKERSEGRPP